MVIIKFFCKVVVLEIEIGFWLWVVFNFLVVWNNFFRIGLNIIFICGILLINNFIEEVEKGYWWVKLVVLFKGFIVYRYLFFLFFNFFVFLFKMLCFGKCCCKILMIIFFVVLFVLVIKFFGLFFFWIFWRLF